MNKKILYINGDSWLAHDRMSEFLLEHYTIFDDYIYINHSIPGDSNYNIINRTIKNVNELKKQGFDPYVIVGLSEVGRGFHKEVSWLLPEKSKNNHLNEYFESLLKFEVNFLKENLADTPNYICSSWTTGVTNKNFADFILPDSHELPKAYAMMSYNIEWFVKRKKLFNLTKESIIEVIENSEKYKEKIMSTGLVDETIHLDQSKESYDIYLQFFEHALNHININNI